MSPRARPRPRVASRDVSGLLCDFAAEYLSSRGHGVLLVELAPSILERLVIDALAADLRLVETQPGRWELADKYDARVAMTSQVA